MADVPETDVCKAESDCDDGKPTDKGQEDVPFLESDLSLMKHNVENGSNSMEDITSQTDDCSYCITWTVYIALALPRGEESEMDKNARTDSSNSLVKTYKSQSCYHIEYKLLPGDEETVKADLIMFGPVAKMCKEDELKIKLKICNSKDKLCSLARYEKQKSFKLPQDLPEDTTDIFKNILKTDRQQPISESYDVEDIKKNGTTEVHVSLICLLAGHSSVTEHFPVRSCGVFDVMCNISLDRPLLSDQLKVELNPLVITLLSAKSMPSSPVPFNVLQEKCMPVYCQYKFHNFSLHRTKHHKHGPNIYFRDVNVILTGLMSPQEIQEFLSSTSLQIEVHDRDRKLEETRKTPAMHGTGSGDPMQSDAAPFKHEMKAFDSYGVVNLDLSELLHQVKRLKLYLPIKCCPPPPQQDRKTTAQNRTVADIDANRDPMPPARYYDSNSQLKVTVEIAHPLNINDDSCLSGSYHGPFGRIIYLFHYNNVSVMTKLRTEILTINASAFRLGSRSLEDIERALSNYKINFKHDESKDLDFVSGFHVLDKRRHIFVLEGLRDKAVRRLWEAVPMKVKGSEEERLCQLSQVRQLKDVVRYNLFPSADMILSLRKKYGICEEQWKQKARTNTEMDPPSLPVRMRRHMPLDIYNTSVGWKRKNHEMQLQNPRDFIQVPGRRFTYSQQYHSATVEPGERSDSRSEASEVWFSSMKSVKSTVHPRHPDKARVEELRKPWRENILHANTLKPTLARDRWVWSQRHDDFQIYSKPPPFFGTPSDTFYLAGERLQQHQLEAARAPLKKILPGSSTNRPHNSSVSVFMGGNSETIQDTLKDEPEKYSLRKPGLMLRPLPKPSVMNLHDNKVETPTLAQGLCMDHRKNNSIPRCFSLNNKDYIGMPMTDTEKRIFTFQKGMKTPSSIKPSRNTLH
ncbi:hypothetical protein INR49_012738, partial [Caranx melampygus]